jgi:hypothetical protein
VELRLGSETQLTRPRDVAVSRAPRTSA